MAKTAPAPRVDPEGKRQLGVSRPPLTLADLPSPEEVFGVKQIRFKELIKFAVGPSLIALGISIGSGEFLLGPLAVGTFGFVGVGWVITLSAILQTFYNIEISRYVVATGEVPVLGFARVPPGRLLWVPFSILTLYFAFIFGGWAAAAGAGVFAFFNGHVPESGDLQTVRFFAIGLLFIVFVITVLAKKVSRGLELTNWFLVGAVLIGLLVLDLAIVPFSVWWEGIRGLLTPAVPPEGITATQLGGLAGFTALSSSLNWYVMCHYRDKGYGMGHRVGYISGMRGDRSELLASGFIFPDDEKNTTLWKRWFGLLKIDMWGVFFGGAMLGMLLPTVLMAHMVASTGETPTEENVPTFVADKLGDQYGSPVFYLTLLLGVFILFSTQLGIFEALVRNFTDSANGMSPKLRALIDDDPRKFYYPFMLVVLAIVAIALHLALPVRLVSISANMSNFGAFSFPFLLIYLNRRLPKAARPGPLHYVALLVGVVFFGFFFINFAYEFITGSALVKF
jgi:hypothetical protein